MENELFRSLLPWGGAFFLCHMVNNSSHFFQKINHGDLYLQMLSVISNCLSVFVCTKRGIIWGTMLAPKALMTLVSFPLSSLMARRFLIHRFIIMMVLVVS